MLEVYLGFAVSMKLKESESITSVRVRNISSLFHYINT